MYENVIYKNINQLLNTANEHIYFTLWLFSLIPFTGPGTPGHLGTPAIPVLPLGVKWEI